MAIYNEILVGRYARALQKLFGIKGSVPAKQLAGELMAVHSIFNGVENRYLEGWDRFGGVTDVPAVALNQSGVRFRNPLSSNLIAVFENILITTFAAVKVSTYLGAFNADLASAAAAYGRLDARTQRNSSIIPSFQNNAVSVPPIGAQIIQFSSTATVVMFELIGFEEQEIALLPGDSLEVVNNTVNSELTVSAIWRERFLEDSERT